MPEDKPTTLDPVARLRSFIRDGGYAEGVRLPPERDLTNELGMSRATLRKALDALERDGVIWRHVGKGTFVADGSQRDTTDASVQLGRQLTPFRMMRARLAIEPAIAREAAINASGQALLRMEQVLERSRALDFRNAPVLRDLGTAYAKTGQNGMASLATAERYALQGDMKTANTHATRAMGLLPRGAPSWRRAEDVQIAAEAALKNRKRK